MKYALACFLAVALISISATALASPIIELADGSRIQGEIRGIENGVYTIDSPTLGTLHVAQTDIARIDYGNRPALHDEDIGSQAASLQAELANDPDAMRLILQLQDDPQIQALLNDPQIMESIQKGDYSGLMNNPKIQSLETDAKIQELLRHVQH